MTSMYTVFSPLERYQAAMTRQAAAEGDVKRWADARAVAIADALDAGMTIRQLAAELGLSGARISQLAARGRAVKGGGK